MAIGNDDERLSESVSILWYESSHPQGIQAAANCPRGLPRTWQLAAVTGKQPRWTGRQASALVRVTASQSSHTDRAAVTMAATPEPMPSPNANAAEEPPQMISPETAVAVTVTDPHTGSGARRAEG